MRHAVLLVVGLLLGGMLSTATFAQGVPAPAPAAMRDKSDSAVDQAPRERDFEYVRVRRSAWDKMKSDQVQAAQRILELANEVAKLRAENDSLKKRQMNGVVNK
jgi:hypothetical protein